MGGGRMFLLGAMLVLSWVALGAIGIGEEGSAHRFAWIFWLLVPPTACVIAYTLGCEERR